VLARGMADAEHPVFVSTLTVGADAMVRRHPGIVADAERARILRSVLMKPESEEHVSRLHARVEELTGRLARKLTIPWP